MAEKKGNQTITGKKLKKGVAKGLTDQRSKVGQAPEEDVMDPLGVFSILNDIEAAVGISPDQQPHETSSPQTQPDTQPSAQPESQPKKQEKKQEKRPAKTQAKKQGKKQAKKTNKKANKKAGKKPAFPTTWTPDTRAIPKQPPLKETAAWGELQRLNQKLKDVPLTPEAADSKKRIQRSFEKMRATEAFYDRWSTDEERAQAAETLDRIQEEEDKEQQAILDRLTSGAPTQRRPRQAPGQRSYITKEDYDYNSGFDFGEVGFVPAPEPGTHPDLIENYDKPVKESEPIMPADGELERRRKAKREGSVLGKLAKAWHSVEKTLGNLFGAAREGIKTFIEDSRNHSDWVDSYTRTVNGKVQHVKGYHRNNGGNK